MKILLLILLMTAQSSGRTLQYLKCKNRTDRPISLQIDYADKVPYLYWPVPAKTTVTIPWGNTPELFLFVADPYGPVGIHTNGGTLHCHFKWQRKP